MQNYILKTKSCIYYSLLAQAHLFNFAFLIALYPVSLCKNPNTHWFVATLRTMSLMFEFGFCFSI